jgi:hypothetical protein
MLTALETFWTFHLRRTGYAHVIPLIAIEASFLVPWYFLLVHLFSILTPVLACRFRFLLSIIKNFLF